MTEIYRSGDNGDSFQCGDNPALVGYLYGECEPAERRAIDQHLLICPACAAELAALDSTRGHLAAWTPPDAQLGFRMVAEPVLDTPVNVVKGPARWWSRAVPVWAQAAAAAAIFAAGVSLGVWRGTTAEPSATAVAAASSPATANVASTSDLAALEQRLRSEMAQMRTAAPLTVAAPQAASVSEAQILARVRTLIDESEQRQQRELALRTAQVVRDFDSQRRVDLQNVRSIVGQVEGSTGAEIARQQQTLQYLMRVSQQK
jgi:anti-sigma factor RsiW